MSDKGETRDISAQHPETLKELLAILATCDTTAWPLGQSRVSAQIGAGTCHSRKKGAVQSD